MPFSYFILPLCVIESNLLSVQIAIDFKWKQVICMFCDNKEGEMTCTREWQVYLNSCTSKPVYQVTKLMVYLKNVF